MNTACILEQTDLDRVLAGEAPVSSGALQALTAGAGSLVSFLDTHYLNDFIARGGSKIKFVVGRRGSGKTHLVRLLEDRAREREYLTVSLSARTLWLHDFREIYLEILRQADIEQVLAGCARSIIRNMDQDPDQIPEGQTFMDYLAEKGEADALSRSSIRTSLREFFTRNPLLDNSFASCCSLLTGCLLGHPILERSSRDLLLSYLHGDKTVKLALLRALGLSPSRITRYNARYLLRSLAEVVRLAGYRGLLITIDDMETLLNRSGSDRNRYTRLRRDDAYENIRALIDDIDNMHGVLFILAADRDLVENESYGVRSYQALWLRIQNEILSPRFNFFADMIDLDRFGRETYDTEILTEMAERLSEVIRASAPDTPVRPLPAEDAASLLERSLYGGLGLPYLVNRAVLEGGDQNV